MQKAPAHFTPAAMLILAFALSPTSPRSQEKGPAPPQRMAPAAGPSGPIAQRSVLRILCPGQQNFGTGFLHRSGAVITAAHVVGGAEAKDIFILPPEGEMVKVRRVTVSPESDLALLIPESPINAEALQISPASEDLFPVGTSVSAWGYPAGYSGRSPLLVIGYLSGLNRIIREGGKTQALWVVNAAFNVGNSGGPLIRQDDGMVIGVVISKLAPIPREVEESIIMLESAAPRGRPYVRTAPDGSKVTFSEGELVSLVTRYLRGQIQLVMGQAVTCDDLRAFLRQSGVAP